MGKKDKKKKKNNKVETTETENITQEVIKGEIIVDDITSSMKAKIEDAKAKLSAFNKIKKLTVEIKKIEKSLSRKKARLEVLAAQL